MPIHDWTRVPSGLFHAFHQTWSVLLQNALNRGVLGSDFYAVVEQRVGGREPDVTAIQIGSAEDDGGGTATLTLPQTRCVQRLPSEAATYAARANRISVRHALGRTVAVIEIVSPGNKESQHAIRSFVGKATELLRAGVHLLIVDLFPPSDRAPSGIHAVIWDEIASDSFELPDDKPLSVVSYHSADEIVARIEPVAVGDRLPEIGLFLGRERFVIPPLESTYAETWGVCPAPIRNLVQPPA